MKPRLLRPLAWPGVSDLDWTTVLEPKTGGIYSLELVERKARRRLYYWGSPPGQVASSQPQGSGFPYYTELFAHEMGHVLHTGLVTPQHMQPVRRVGMRQFIHNYADTVGSRDSNINELMAAATATVVLEMLGLPYYVRKLLGSAASNMRYVNRHFFYSIEEIFPRIVKYRSRREVRRAARHIIHMLGTLEA